MAVYKDVQKEYKHKTFPALCISLSMSPNESLFEVYLSNGFGQYILFISCNMSSKERLSNKH